MCDSLAFSLVFGWWGKFGEIVCRLTLLTLYSLSAPHGHTLKRGQKACSVLKNFPAAPQSQQYFLLKLLFFSASVLLKDLWLWEKVSARYASLLASTHSFYTPPTRPSTWNSREIAFNFAHLFFFRLCLSYILVECFYSVFLIVVSLESSRLTFLLS